MSTVREIMMARAKKPAKVHSMDRGGDISASCPPSAAVSPMHAQAPRPSVVQFGDAEQAGDGECLTGSTSGGAPKPPRLPGGAGATGVALPPRGRAAARSPGVVTPTKSSEGRRPRPNSEPGGRSNGTRAPSEPPRGSTTGGVGGATRGVAEGGSGAKKSVARSASVPRARIGDSAPPVERKNVGRVPAYLKKRQEEWAEDDRIASLPHEPKAPPGYRRVLEAERQGTIDTLKRRKSEVEKEQNKLPFKIETAGQKQREKELAGRFAHLEKLLDMFSKPVVFVPQDSEPIVNTLTTPTSAAAPVRGSNSILPCDDDSEGGVESGPMPGSVGAAGRPPPVQSRERRAAASSERRAVCVGAAAPWDREPDEGTVASKVRVVNPPGGKSSVMFGE